MRNVSRAAVALILGTVALVAGCTAQPPVVPGEPVTSTSSTSTTQPLVNCPFRAGTLAGTIANPFVVEASGIAASRRSPGVLWVHNDSGDTARLFATTIAGRDLGIYPVTGVTAADWEDIAVGPSPAGAGSFLYVGDIGGNAGRNALTIQRIPEPAVSTTQNPTTIDLGGAQAIDVVYPNGGRYDAESLMVDTNGDLYIVTKSTEGSSLVFRLPAAQQTPGATQTLQQVASIQFTKPGNQAATSGDLSPSGDTIVVRTYNRAYVWTRPAGTSVAQALAGRPCVLTVIIEPGAEAIAFAPNGRDILTTSEGASPPINLYTRN